MSRAPGLASCPACGGLSPRARATCVHCDARLGGRAGRAGRLAGGLARALGRTALAGGALVTLMACYGMSARHMSTAHCIDNDVDGVCADRDCDDRDASVYPGAEDPDGDGVDQDCDGADGARDPAAMAVPGGSEPAPADPLAP